MKEFAVTALDLEYKAFVLYIAALSVDLSDKIHPFKRAEIAYLKANKTFTKVLSKYTDLADIFSPKLAT